MAANFEIIIKIFKPLSEQYLAFQFSIITTIVMQIHFYVTSEVIPIITIIIPYFSSYSNQITQIKIVIMVNQLQSFIKVIKTIIIVKPNLNCLQVVNYYFKNYLNLFIFQYLFQFISKICFYSHLEVRMGILKFLQKWDLLFFYQINFDLLLIFIIDQFKILFINLIHFQYLRPRDY